MEKEKNWKNDTGCWILDAGYWICKERYFTENLIINKKCPKI
jgi:hypothetical protein